MSERRLNGGDVVDTVRSRTVTSDGRQNRKTFTRYMMDGFVDYGVITGGRLLWACAVVLCQHSLGYSGKRTIIWESLERLRYVIF